MNRIICDDNARNSKYILANFCALSAIVVRGVEWSKALSLGKEVIEAFQLETRHCQASFALM